MNQAPRSIYS
jgi:ribonuclease HI